MRVLIRGGLFLASACMAAGVTCWGQPNQKPFQLPKVSVDLGVTFAGERSKPDPSLCCFWLKGGGLDVAATFWRGFGIAASVTGDHSADYLPSTDENRISWVVGPRYTFQAWKRHARAEDQRRLQLFGQGLVGVAYGFNTRFSNGATSASELAVQAGGGLNFYLTKRFGIRPIDIEFVRTQIGTTGFSTQNDLRLATGLTWHF